ncbi:transcriptional regulator [Azorhizobium oxalatiphilum]|uniref:Transcriptional regulator n=1 Tax=Azorhizobium oxalatiphilum TaxID=980631 RepID=A0A917CH28_9HYPH|nr:helix-turn-helix transcriptional regulator [Azorhizobium oxalatiphilum]GGF88835.1 transcriptional regulator [Azorhizobium oxalatiphilum]
MLRDQAVTLVGRIYEAAAVPDLWPDVLDTIARNVNAAGACLFTPGGTAARWIASPAFAEDVSRFIAEGWLDRDGFNDRLEASGRTGFVGDLDLFHAEELAREPVYAEWLYPRGFGWGASTLMRLPHERTVFMNVERHYGAGPVQGEDMRILEGLHPHLARASMISTHLTLERAKAASSALQIISLPAALVRPHGRLESANTLFEALMPQVVRACDPAVILANGQAQAALMDALARIEAGVGVGRAIPLPPQPGGEAHVFHVLPVRGAARDVFTACVALILATPVVARPVLPPELLVQLFDLTPAEARVAHRIASGATVEATAEVLGVSRETVRSQLKAALAKLGLTRQAELVGLLAAAAPRFGSRPPER